MRVENVDILDDREPTILVQRYYGPNRSYLVMRKPTSPTEDFELSPGIKIDADQVWHVHLLLETPVDEESDEAEVFATVDADEAEAIDDDDVYALIVRDRETGIFGGEAVWESQGDIFDAIATTAIDDAIEQAIERIDAWLLANPDEA